MVTSASTEANGPIDSSIPIARLRKRLGKKEKAKLRNVDEEEKELVEEIEELEIVEEVQDEWSWIPLADDTSFSCPIVFSSDSIYSFVAVGSIIKIYSVLSGQLASVLSVPTASTDRNPRSTKVTSVLLNPSNHLQLLVGSLDGLLRIWDYSEGKLLRTLDLGSPIQHACGHPSLLDQLFVALVAPKEKAQDSTVAGVYSISLKAKISEAAISPLVPRTPSRRMRLAQPRIVLALECSGSGQFLVALNPQQINICDVSNLPAGFSITLESEVRLTCVGFHPTENYFATGDESGRIRVWYDVLQDKSKVLEGSSTSLLHWHVHPVNSLRFTPNGAYLVSGGEESVLVLWQLSTGTKEFIPRLGAPIKTISISNSPKQEQLIATRLRDGTIHFIATKNLKISRSITDIKPDPVLLNNTKRSARIPLAIQPFTNCLVLPAAHPSSLQFYSPSEDAQTMQLEVSPSNRVSSITSTQLEPTRVELVSFSQPEKHGGKNSGSYWMATLDCWSSESHAAERHIKFWRHGFNQAGFSLSTRIDDPHDGAITSMTFSPSSISPLLLTTSMDGTIKVWAYILDSWRCTTCLSYRSFIPLDATWSLDGSMFAVAHAKSVTLWSLSSNSLIQAFPCKAISPITKVNFVGEGGTNLLVGGRHGTMIWDLLTFEETFNLALVVNDLTVKPKSSTFLATEANTFNRNLSEVSNTAFLVDTATDSIEPKTLPFAIKQSTWINNSISKNSQIISLAVVDDKGEVSLLEQGSSLRSQFIISTPTRLPTTSSGQSQLFDDIFGTAETTLKSTNLVAPTSVKSKSLEILNAPSHSLPPARLLWRSMLDLATKIDRTPRKQEGDSIMELDIEAVISNDAPAEVKISAEDLTKLFMEIL